MQQSLNNFLVSFYFSLFSVCFLKQELLYEPLENPTAKQNPGYAT